MLASLLTAFIASASAAEVITYTGFLVDNFCIKGCDGKSDGAACAVDGTNTFTDPAKHHLFCMTDVPQCKESGFSVVEKNTKGFYDRKYALTAEGNAMALQLLEVIKADKGKDTANIVVTVTGTAGSGDLGAIIRPTSISYDNGAFVVYTGFLVDNFCINACKGKSDGAGCALDGTNTFTDPAKHSVHCLIDPPQCKDSGYSVVERSAQGFYEPKYTLDAAGNALAVKYLTPLAKSTTNVQVTIAGKVGAADGCAPAAASNGDQATCITASSLVAAAAPPVGAAPAPTPPAAAAMAASQVPGYTTTVELQAGAFWLSYELDKAARKLRVAFQVAPAKVDNGQGWAAVGFSSDGRMVGSQAVIFEGLGQPKVYRLGGQTRDLVKVEPNQEAFFAGGAATSVEPTTVSSAGSGGRSLLAPSKRITYKFDLNYDALEPGKFSDSAPTHILHAFNTGPLAWHTFGNKGSDLVDLTTGVARAMVDETADLYAKHGFLMMFGWGVCIPFGVTSARFFKRHSPYWFYCHVGANILGLVLATAGFAIALSKFDVFTAGAPALSTVHGKVGIAVMTLGYFQPIMAQFRPHAAKPGEDVGAARKVWNLLHWGLGRAATLLAFANICIGIHLARALTSGSKVPALDALNVLIYAVLIGFGVLWIFILHPIQYLSSSGSREAEARLEPTTPRVNEASV